MPSPEHLTFQGITDPILRNSLIDFGRFLKTRSLPIAVSNFSFHTYSEHLSLRVQDMNWLLRDALKKGIMDAQLLHLSPTSSRTIRAFDKNDCLAFKALVYSMGRRYPRTINDLLNITDPEEEFPWKEIVGQTKTALGTNPLTNLIDFPQEQDEITQEDSPSPGGLAYMDPGLSQAEEDLTSDQKPAMVEDKFPILNDEARKELANTGVVEITKLRDRLPHSSESVNPTHHLVSHSLIKSVMFILMADRNSLSDYLPDDDVSLNEFHLGLKVCKDYLQHKEARRLGIENLEQLLRAIELKIRK